MPFAERHAAAELRVAKALEHIERAQNELARACQQLSAIQGAAPSYRRAFRLHDLVKASWYALAGRSRSKWKLDHEPAAVHPTATEGT